MPEKRPRVAHELPPRDYQVQVFPAGRADAPGTEPEQPGAGHRSEDGGVGGYDQL